MKMKTSSQSLFRTLARSSPFGLLSFGTLFPLSSFLFPLSNSVAFSLKHDVLVPTYAPAYRVSAQCILSYRDQCSVILFFTGQVLRNWEVRIASVSYPQRWRILQLVKTLPYLADRDLLLSSIHFIPELIS